MPLTGNTKREYQRNWIANRRLKLIEKLGGECVDCGSLKHLEFDHNNLELKRLEVKHILSSNWNRSDIIQELKNVVLRCNDCHKEKSKSEIIPAKHGKSKYGRGCKCDVCRAGHAEYRRERRALGYKS